MDLETRRKKQQALMVQMVERKVRSRAQQLYEDRGQIDGQELQDWFQAESEVLEDKIIGPLYRRIKIHDIERVKMEINKEPVRLRLNSSPYSRL